MNGYKKTRSGYVSFIVNWACKLLHLVLLIYPSYQIVQTEVDLISYQFTYQVLTITYSNKYKLKDETY